MDDWSQIARGSLRTPEQVACAFDLDVAGSPQDLPSF